jgi:hypothetical protein
VGCLLLCASKRLCIRPAGMGVHAVELTPATLAPVLPEGEEDDDEEGNYCAQLAELPEGLRALAGEVRELAVRRDPDTFCRGVCVGWSEVLLLFIMITEGPNKKTVRVGGRPAFHSYCSWIPDGAETQFQPGPARPGSDPARAGLCVCVESRCLF